MTTYCRFGITTLLSIDFIKLVLISIVLAVPISWYFINSWLEDFAYRIHVSWWTFALAGISALVIALVTVSYQAIKAALQNPVYLIKIIKKQQLCLKRILKSHGEI